MTDEIFIMSDSPIYQENIQKIKESDEVHERVVNPILQKIIENTQFVKKQQESHNAENNNPHAVTKNQIGLENVDNTSDADKPVSAAVQTALNEKANLSHIHAAIDVTQDSSHRFSTDEEKIFWNGKSNPNLLDNWYFVVPINQRIIKTWTEDQKFVIDRWLFKNNSGDASITVGNGCVSFQGRDQDGIRQTMESNLREGATYTFSILTKENQLFYGSAIPSADGSAISFGDATPWSAVLYNNGVDGPFIVGNDAAQTLNVIAVKLEEGSRQTLARQENGNWILNDPPPDPALELLKCQRYYFVTYTGHGFPGGFRQVGKGAMFVPHQIQMRAIPSVNVLLYGVILKGEQLFRVDNSVVTIFHQDAMGIKLNVKPNNDNISTIGPVYFMDWCFEFSAEI